MISARLRAASVCLSVLIGSASLLAAQSELVIVKEGTKEYHRAGCDVIRDGKGVLALTRAQAEARGFRQHPSCDPVKSVPTKPESDTTAPPVQVFVDGSKYYHRGRRTS